VGMNGMRGAGTMKKNRPSRTSMALGRAKFICNECGLELPTPTELSDHIMVHGM
jgi:hypothetical protein